VAIQADKTLTITVKQTSDESFDFAFSRSLTSQLFFGHAAATPEEPDVIRVLRLNAYKSRFSNAPASPLMVEQTEKLLSCAVGQLRRIAETNYEVKAYTAAKAAQKNAAKKPLYDWNTVTISAKSLRGESKGGTHASPRPHDRRGHYRTLKSGKQVWVRNMRVGKGDGFIFKDYVVKP
jgi:hypothetical protein